MDIRRRSQQGNLATGFDGGIHDLKFTGEASASAASFLTANSRCIEHFPACHQDNCPAITQNHTPGSCPSSNNLQRLLSVKYRML
jgi:hypothetical protein